VALLLQVFGHGSKAWTLTDDIVTLFALKFTEWSKHAYKQHLFVCTGPHILFAALGRSGIMTRFTWPAALVALAVAAVDARPKLLPFAPFTQSEDLTTYACPSRPVNATDNYVDFLILGAGLSGLGAAHYLHSHTHNCSIRIIEAQDRPGGRVKTLDKGPFAGMEIGAGWIHEYKGNPMLAVADANGIYAKVC
jgi:hypothetical protein